MHARTLARGAWLRCAALFPRTAHVADQELRYNVEYLCGMERILVESCARDRPT